MQLATLDLHACKKQHCLDKAERNEFQLWLFDSHRTVNWCSAQGWDSDTKNTSNTKMKNSM